LLNKLCSNITNTIKANLKSIDGQKAEIINYGLYLWITDIIKLIAILSTAYFLKIFIQTIIFLISFGILRTFTGGSHAKTFFGCLISYALITFGTVYLSIWLSSFINPLIIYMILIPFCTLVVYFLVPSDHENKPVTSKKQRKRLKIISYIILFTEFLASILFDEILIAFSIFMVCLGILPITYKLMGNRYGNGL
jgi:accessory gene regulator B